MAVNGKQKGNTFERTISNMLSERFCEHLGLEQGFRRNPDSGSFFGGSNKSRVETHDTDFAVYGDLICPRSFIFSIECKSYKTPPTLDSIAKQSVKQWDTWISQAEQDAEMGNKETLLVVKYNRTEIMCFLKKSFHATSEWKEIEGFAKYKDYILMSVTDFLSVSDEKFFKE